MNRSVLLLTAIVGVVGSNSLVLSPIAAKVAHSMGAASPTGVMTAAALYGLGVAGSALVLAPLSDRFGAGRSLRAALILLAISLACSALATQIWMLCIAQAFAGIAAGVAIPAIYTLAAQIAPKGHESRVIGTVLTGWTLSMVGGVTLSAYVADIFGWQIVYGGLSAAALLVLLPLLLMKTATVTPSHKTTTPLTALRVEGIFPALGAVALLGMGFYGVYNYLGSHLELFLDRPVRDAGILTLIYGLGFASAIALDGQLDKIPVVRGLAGIFALLFGLYLVMAWAAPSYLLLLFVVPVWGALEHLGLNLTIGWLTRLDPSQRGAIMGLNSAVMYLSVFVATLSYRASFTAYGLAACALISAALSLFAVVFVLQSRKKGKTPQPVSV